MSDELDKYLRHQTYIDRLATNAIKTKLYPSIDASIKAVIKIINESGTPTTPKQIDEIAKAIRKQMLDPSGWAEVTTSMAAMAQYEAGYQQKLSAEILALPLVLPTEAAVKKLTETTPMVLRSGSRVDAGVWESYYYSNLTSGAASIDSIVRAGHSSGKTVTQIAAQVKAFGNGILKRDAEILARTGYVHYAAMAAEAFNNANPQLQQYYYVVTFDNRTSDVCIGVTRFNKSDNRFAKGDPRAPRPPLHYGCRTRRIAVTKSWEPTGTRASVGGQSGAYAEKAFKAKQEKTTKQIKYKGKKDTNIFNPKQVDASLSYDQWLRLQPDWFIRDTLGAKRAKMFADGKPLSSFSDMTGRPLTLAEIAKRDAL
jgi:hypothetical protein